MKKLFVKHFRRTLVFLPAALSLAVLFPAAGSFTASSFQRLYVANEKSNTISVVDPVTRTVIANVATGMGPHNVNVDPQGRYFYVTDHHEGLIQVFDVKTNALVTNIHVGEQPAHVVPDPSGKLLYVSNEGAGTLSIVSVPEFRVRETLQIKGEGPHGHVVSADGHLVLTPNGHSGNVSLIDLVHHKTDLIPLPPGAKPVAMGMTTDGKWAFVTDAGNNQVHKIDVAKETVVGSLTVGKLPIQVPVHPTRPFLYIPCMNDGALYKVDINQWKVVKVIPVGKGAHGIAFSADGKLAYVTLSWEKPKGQIAIVDTEKDTLVGTLAVEESPNGVSLLNGKNQGAS